MTAQHLYTYDNPPSERDLERVLRLLNDDGVIAYPTDVNWAFACDAASSKALDRIHQLKPSHPKDLPFALLCASISMASDYATIEHAAYRYLRKAWPGPYTVLLSSTRSLPRQLKDKRRVVGIRIPQAPLILAILERYGKAIATTSVPRVATGVVQRGQDEETSALRFGYEVQEHFGHALDLVLDLGEESMGLESTIIDFTSGAPELVRRGVGDPSLFDL